MKTMSYFITICALSTAIFIHCKKPDPPINSSPPHSSPTPRLAASSLLDKTAEAALGKKLSKYAKCVNDFSIQAHESFLRYRSWCRKGCEKNGPSADEPNMDMGLFALPDPTDCLKEIKEANVLIPSLPALENSAIKFSHELSILYPVLAEAHQYYEQRSYQADQGAKGRELHPKLLSAWKNFDKADQELRDQFELVHKDHAMQRLHEIEKSQGRTLRFLTSNIMIKSKFVFQATLVEQWNQNHLEVLAQRIGDYEKAVDELEHYIDFAQFPDHQKEATVIGGFSFFPAASKHFLKSAQTLIQQIRERKPMPRGSAIGSKENLLRTYTDLVDRANALNFGD